MSQPNFLLEKQAFSKGYRCIVGVDEVGCGALAGPVFAAAVVLPTNSTISGLNDSKKLTEKKREELFEQIKEEAEQFAIGQASIEEIAQLNIRQATFLAMRRAILEISGVDFILVDGWEISRCALPQQVVIKGDQKVKSIAAASILAKVSRDRLMKGFHEQYPVYGFDAHKGYATQKHRDAIKEHGACPIHRLSYKTFQPNLFTKGG